MPTTRELLDISEHSIRVVFVAHTAVFVLHRVVFETATVFWSPQLLLIFLISNEAASLLKTKTSATSKGSSSASKQVKSATPI